MGPYGGLSLRGGQQAALPLIGTWNLEPLLSQLTNILSPSHWCQFSPVILFQVIQPSLKYSEIEGQLKLVAIQPLSQMTVHKSIAKV